MKGVPPERNYSPPFHHRLSAIRPSSSSEHRCVYVSPPQPSTHSVPPATASWKLNLGEQRLFNPPPSKKKDLPLRHTHHASAQIWRLMLHEMASQASSSEVTSVLLALMVWRLKNKKPLLWSGAGGNPHGWRFSALNKILYMLLLISQNI